MNGYQQIKKQLLPLIKGTPIIIGTLILALFIGRIVIRYSSEKYQSIAKIKLDDQKIGFSSNEIYKDFSMFSLQQRIEAEVELLKSPIIIEKAIDSLSLDTEITRVGNLKRTILYGNCPFKVSSLNTAKPKIAHFDLQIKKGNKFIIKNESSSTNGVLGKAIYWMGDSINIQSTNIDNDKSKFDLIGNYSVRIFPRSEIIAEIASRIDVSASDKETPIIRVTYVDRNPKRAADIINAVCNAYINDFVTTKSAAASGTVSFIDQELQSISKKLSNSERNLEVFKTNENVVNTKQETETGLREISQLRIDMINLEINERAMRDLEGYIDQGSYFSETAINFGFGDLVLTELVKKLKMLNDERIDLLSKFTRNSPQIIGIDKKVDEIKGYIKKAVKRNLSDLEIRRKGIQQNYDIQSHMFDELPTREKEQHILERDFMINESVYNFLSKKRIDAAILANSMISFHRVIHPAVEASEPMSPNRTLIKFVSGLLGLLGGIGLVYLRKLISEKIVSREDIEKNSALPFAGVIRKGASPKEFGILFRSVQMKHKLNNGSVIGICSANNLDGKKYLASNLAKSIRSYEYSCAIVSFGIKAASQPEKSEFVIADSSNDMEEQIKQISKQHDYTLLVGPASTQDVLAVKVLDLADLGLFVFRANFTGINCVQEPDNLVDEYKLKNVELILNGAHKATNYRGSYIGTRFTVPAINGNSFVQKMKHYYKVYIKK